MLMLSAVTRANRHGVMREIDDAAVSCGGWIEGHTLFSNVAATFRFVLPAGGLEAFAARIAAAGLQLDGAGLAALSKRVASAAADDELPGALAVTFVHDEPDLRREIPAVPG
ncbi:hypothetical protein AWJ14_01655 [Hoeflea olei]|uniref:Uncharacterized protein n=2 Tax=Hoeflea olei TaxID=1480615 RepID=A0A1C1YVJ3_9HYPH|nr:hypothetical protein AWJ14_01655 [Hoeflea olei]